MARNFIAAILFQALLLCNVYGTIYKQFRIDKRIEVNSFYEITKVTSMSRCAIRCLTSSPCQTSTYDVQKKECSLSIDTISAATYTGNESKKTLRMLDDEPTCHAGWELFKFHCYHFNGSPKNFQNAENFCQSQGGHLVSIHDRAEKDFVRNRMMELPATKFWIGMSDEDVEGTWKWIDTSEQVVYTDWYYTQPNQGTECNCAGVWETRNYQWVDEPCSAIYVPVCKKPALQP